MTVLDRASEVQWSLAMPRVSVRRVNSPARDATYQARLEAAKSGWERGCFRSKLAAARAHNVSQEVIYH